ncbi:type IX secretion component PorD family protein, partial [Escherichia coli]
CNTVQAQELQAKVTVLASRVNTTVDRKIFTTLQQQLNSFMNNRKWTDDVFKPNEKIECSFIINIENIIETNLYKATLTIQAARPVYNASYQAAMVNFVDPEMVFRYVEFQPIEFNENRVQGTEPGAANLTAVLAFWAYTIIGL